MPDKRITYRLEPRGAWELWANHMGSHAKARESALRLKAELREDHPRAVVAIDGKFVNGDKP